MFVYTRDKCQNRTLIGLKKEEKTKIKRTATNVTHQVGQVSSVDPPSPRRHPVGATLLFLRCVRVHPPDVTKQKIKSERCTTHAPPPTTTTEKKERENQKKPAFDGFLQKQTNTYSHTQKK